MEKRLFIFNPETDYALASDREYYTPPGNVIEMRRNMCLIPSILANEEDAILLLDDISFEKYQTLPYYSNVSKKKLSIFKMTDLENDIELQSQYIAIPWGWNRSIRRTLLDRLPMLRGIPDANYINKLRQLSHRRTTIRMFDEMRTIISPNIHYPIEIYDVEDGIKLFRQNRNLYFKVPWSSSGRGILLADDREEKHVRPWLSGIIRRQGSVMVETAYDRKLDFATEWNISEDGYVDFLGYSVFNVSRRGKYHSNESGDQNKLHEIIKRTSEKWNDEIIEVQQQTIGKVIAPSYHGPLGIDMLITTDGDINPCVEINLRHTMGMLNLESTH